MILSILLTGLALVRVGAANAPPNGFGNSYNAGDRNVSETTHRLVHLPLYFNQSKWSNPGCPVANVLVGESRTPFYPCMDLGSGAPWFATWPGGGYDMKGRDLNGSIPQMHVQYLGSKPMQGPWFQDHIYIKGRAEDGQAAWVTQNLDFGAINATGLQGNGLQDVPGSSLLGLAYSSASRGHPPELFEGLIQSGAVGEREFAFSLPPTSAGENGTGQLTLGGRDLGKYTGPIGTAYVYESSSWSFLIDDLLEPSGAPMHLNLTDRIAGTDSGWGGFHAPLTPAMRWHQLIPNATILTINDRPMNGSARADLLNYRNGSSIGGYAYDKINNVTFAIPCNTNQAQVPWVVIGDVPLQMSVQEFVGTSTPDTGELSGMCQSGLDSRKGGSHWVFGQVWLRSFYSIFRWGASTAGNEVGNGTSVSYARAAPYQAYEYPPN